MKTIVSAHVSDRVRTKTGKRFMVAVCVAVALAVLAMLPLMLDWFKT